MESFDAARCLRFSARTAVGAATNRLTQAYAERAAIGPVFDLTVANPTDAGIPYDAAAILGAFQQTENLRYEPLPFGLPSAREAVAADLRTHGTNVTAEQVVLTASTSEAYSWLFTLLCDPGDAVLVPAPSYPLFDFLAKFSGVELIPYPVRYDGAHYIDVRDLEERRTDRTRAILVVSPNNPTGHYLKEAERRQLLSLDLPIVSDEVFARYPLRDDPTRVTSVAGHEKRGLVFALSGLSKLAALPQMKCGWIVVDGAPPYVEETLERLEWIADTFLSVSTPVQRALPALLASRDVQESAIRARCARNLSYLRRCLQDAPISLRDLEGGWYATLRLPVHLDEENFCVDLLRTCGIVVHPGSFFDHDEGSLVVVSLLTPPSTFEYATPILIREVCKEA